MSMLNEVEKFIGDTGLCTNYRTINLGGKYLYVEGIKNVIDFSVNEMLFQLKKQALCVNGENLKIKYLDKTTCVIEGQIFSVQIK